MEEFIRGYTCCLATLLRMKDCTDSMTDELFRSGIGSIQNAKDANVNEYDLEILSKFLGD